MTATSKASRLLFLGRCRLFSACPRLETVEELGRGPTAKQWEDLRDENLLDSRANRGRCGRLSAVGGSPGWATCSQCSPAQPHKPQAHSHQARLSPVLRRARARGCSGAGPIGARDLFVDTRREEVHDDQCDQVAVEIRRKDLPLRPRRNACRCAARVSTASGNASWRTNSENSLCSQRVKKDWPRGWMVIHSVPAASSSRLRQNSLFDAEHGRRKHNAVFQG